MSKRELFPYAQTHTLAIRQQIQNTREPDERRVHLFNIFNNTNKNSPPRKKQERRRRSSFCAEHDTQRYTKGIQQTHANFTFATVKEHQENASGRCGRTKCYEAITMHCTTAEKFITIKEQVLVFVKRILDSKDKQKNRETQVRILPKLLEILIFPITFLYRTPA